MEHESDDDNNCNWCAWNGFYGVGKRTKRVGNRRTNRDGPNYSIVEIGQKAEKSPRDLNRFAVSQTPVREHQLTLV